MQSVAATHDWSLTKPATNRAIQRFNDSVAVRRPRSTVLAG